MKNETNYEVQNEVVLKKQWKAYSKCSKRLLTINLSKLEEVYEFLNIAGNSKI